MDPFEERLAEQVRHYKHLYNAGSKDHKQQQEPEFCKKKWNNLRDKFVHARKRAKEKKSGDAGGYKPVPKLYIQLQWLESSQLAYTERQRQICPYVCGAGYLFRTRPKYGRHRGLEGFFSGK